MSVVRPWWHPDAFARRAPALRARAALKQAVRGYFDAQSFLEVETPVLQASPGNETHISAFATEAVGDDGVRQPFYLHTSPEFACKKLLAAGVERLFTLTPVFRNRERGRLHHPEFAMLEWYRAGGSLETLMEDCVALLRLAADAGGKGKLHYRGNAVDPSVAPAVLPVVEAFHRHAGLDLESLLPDTRDALQRFAKAATALGVRVSADDTWSDLFSKVLSVWVEPNLGLDRPTFLTRYPASEAALARPCPDDPRFAERFELYCCGVELANAFGELTDADEQRSRFTAAENERARIYGERHPIDEDFLAALAMMPESVGIALGFDRLVMLAVSTEQIDDVLWAPVAARAS